MSLQQGLFQRTDLPFFPRPVENFFPPLAFTERSLLRHFGRRAWKFEFIFPDDRRAFFFDTTRRGSVFSSPGVVPSFVTGVVIFCIFLFSALVGSLSKTRIDFFCRRG